MKVLLTGFEPFGGYTINPSQLLIQALPDHYLGMDLVKQILPVDHQQGPQKMLALLRSHQPDAVIAFGLASGRVQISLERVALNLLDFPIADNAGVIVENQPIVPGGPAAYFSTLPLLAMQAALKAEEISAEFSLSAGAYLCNQVFYTLMHEIVSQDLNTQAGFVHLPDLPEQTAQASRPVPSMSLEVQIQAAHILVAQLGSSN
ncbi:MAG: pyroglutamyl-peptidase I [Brevefilum sp.]|nr:pyroglutamyl-peptidase I [Brevefilum sp.]